MILSVNDVVRLNTVSIVIKGQTIPVNTIGAVVNAWLTCEIAWNINGKNVTVEMEANQLKKLVESNIIEKIGEFQVPSEPKFKIGQLVEDDCGYCYMIKKAEYDVAEKQYRYNVKSLEYLLEEVSSIDFELENDLKECISYSTNYENTDSAMKYKINIKKVEE